MSEIDGGVGEEVTALETSLGDAREALAAQDCATACKALASIRRAADRICALEPGTRCDDARSKAEQARRQVADACPDCAVAQMPGKDEERRAATKEEVASVQSAPSRGGCASCATTGSAGSGDLALVVLGVFAFSRVVRRRTR